MKKLPMPEKLSRIKIKYGLPEQQTFGKGARCFLSGFSVGGGMRTLWQEEKSVKALDSYPKGRYIITKCKYYIGRAV